MKQILVSLVRDDQGQDLIEYAMLATLIALVGGATAATLGTNLATWYTNMGNRVQTWAGQAAS